MFKMKKLVFILVFVLLIGTFSATKAGNILEFISEWVANGEDTQIKTQYFARLDGIEVFCTFSEQLSCVLWGETKKSDGFEFYSQREGNGPERIEKQEVQGKLFLIVEDDKHADKILIEVNKTPGTVSETSISTPPTNPIPPITPPSSNPCGHYGKWAVKGPNGDYSCKGGN